MSKKKPQEAKFLNLNLTPKEEEEYLKSKAFFLKISQESEASLKNVNTQLIETQKFVRGLEAFLHSLSDENELFGDVTNVVKNLRATEESEQKRIAKLEDKLIICNHIITTCFTERVEGNQAIVSEEGKIFSKYFSRFLTILEG